MWGVQDSGGEAGYAGTVHAAGKGVHVGTEDGLPVRLRTADGSISAVANIVPEQVIALYGHVRAGRTMGTVRPPLVPAPPSFDAASAAERAAAGPADG